LRRAKLGAKAIGFDFAALSGWRAAQWVDDLVRDPALLRPLLARRGLRLISGWSSGRLLERSVAEELEAVEPHRALLAAIGCTARKLGK
jgi:inosose dehydratase